MGPALKFELRLFINALLSFIETLKNSVQTVWLNHEFLEAFHAYFRHFSWRIAVKELRKARGC